MTDVLESAGDAARHDVPSDGADAVGAAGAAGAAEAGAGTGAGTEAGAATPAPGPGAAGPAPALRALIAGLSAAAGAIHLAMVPSHMGEWAAEGVAFAVAGWLQMATALLIVVRPSRLLLAAAAAANLAFVGAWVVTRTTGAPFGPHAGQAHEASLVDVTTVAIEAALVLVVVLALVRPAPPALAGGRARRGGLAGAGAAVVLASVVLASPSARDHAHGASTGDQAHDGEAAAGGHVHGGEATGVSAAPGGDDRGLAELSNGHHHEMVVHELDAETRAELDDQLAITREVAAQHPTVADAEAAGYQRIGPYFPGIGAHYGRTGGLEMNRDGGFDEEKIAHPFAIIYNGTAPTSRVAGFMYLSMADEEPEGFAGPNDVWHYHEDLCLAYSPSGEIDVPFGLDHQATEAQCTDAGGRLIGLSPWMVHVWSAPGWDDDPEVGTFGEVHTDLTCSDGTYYMLPIEQWVDHRMNVCEADAA
jgi:hypothetical protein